MKKQVIENFNDWIFEAAAPKKPAPKKVETVIPAGYKKTTLPEESIELSPEEEISKAKGWKALADTDILEFNDQKTVSTGLASDKVEAFNKAVKSGGVLVMGPSIYGKGGETSFVVGFPYQQPALEGPNKRDIVLSEKYVLFTPWQNGKANVFIGSGGQNGSAFKQPYDCRLIPVDKLSQIGLQSLMWILGYNNSTAAKKAFLSLTKDQVISTLKGGLAELAKSASIQNANKSGGIIFDGYNALISSPNAHQIMFANFVEGNSKVNVDDLKKDLPLKTA